MRVSAALMVAAVLLGAACRLRAEIAGTALVVTADHRAICQIHVPQLTADTIVRATDFGLHAVLWYPRFSPDGTRIAFTRDDGYNCGPAVIMIAHNDGTHLSEVCSLSDEWVGPILSWTLDNRIYWSEYGSDIFVVDLATGVRTVAASFPQRILEAVVAREGVRAAASWSSPDTLAPAAEVRVYNLVKGSGQSLGGGCQGTISPSGQLVTHNRSGTSVYPNHGWATIDSYATGGVRQVLLPPGASDGMTFNMHRFSRLSDDYILFMVEQTREWYVCQLSTNSVTPIGQDEAGDFAPGPLPAPPAGEPMVVLDTHALSLSVAPGRDTVATGIVQVSNAGQGLLGALDLQQSASWLAVADSLAGLSHILVNRAASAGLGVGAYHAQVTVRAHGALNVDHYAVTLNVGMPLAAPSGLRVQGLSQDSVQLRWYDNSDGETGFVVEQSTDSVTFIPVDSVGSGVVACTSSAPLVSASAWYRVRAYRDTCVSGPSEAVKYTTMSSQTIAVLSPSAQQTLFVGDTVRIRWLADGVYFAIISYSTDNGDYWHTVTVNGVLNSSPNWEYYPWVVPDTPGDTCLVEVADYFWTVRAVSGAFAIREPSACRRPSPGMRRSVAGLTIRRGENGEPVVTIPGSPAGAASVALFDCLGRRLSSLTTVGGGRTQSVFAASRGGAGSLSTGLVFVRVRACTGREGGEPGIDFCVPRVVGP